MTERQKLTKSQDKVLKFIVSYIEKRGIPPTRQEIGDHFGYYHNAADDHVRALERKGYLEIIPRVSRGIRVL